MRWKCIDPNNQQEQADRANVVAKIDAWWKDFQKAMGEFDALFKNKTPRAFQNTDALAKWIHQHLGAVHPKLMWEFGPALKGQGHRLVITPESDRHLRPLTKALLKRAPQIDGWEFYAYRLPEDVSIAHQTVEARAKFNSHDFMVRMARGEHNRIGICYFSPNIKSSEDQNAIHAAFVATETLLGEEILDKWVGAIEVSPLKKPFALGSLFGKRETETKHLIPLDRMKETFDAVVQSVRDQFPAEPHCAWAGEDTPCTLWELKPEEADDYPEQEDLFVARSINPTMWIAAHRGATFFSERFSRSGETFCFVKLDGTERVKEEEFGGKDEIEDALDEVLKPNNLGCTIGGGTGRRYSYIDLALVELGAGLQAVRKRLRAGKVPKRSWIQFFDSDMCAEWVGIYDDTPQPPMPSFEE